MYILNQYKFSVSLLKEKTTAVHLCIFLSRYNFFCHSPGEVSQHKGGATKCFLKWKGALWGEEIWPRLHYTVNQNSKLWCYLAQWMFQTIFCPFLGHVILCFSFVWEEVLGDFGTTSGRLWKFESSWSKPKPNLMFLVYSVKVISILYTKFVRPGLICALHKTVLSSIFLF